VSDFNPALIIAAGAFVGFVVGLTGMGGGALMTPVLVLLFKINPSTAVGSDLVVSLVMKPVGGGVHLRKGTVNLAIVKWLVIGSVPSAFAAVWVLSTFFPKNADTTIQFLIGIALLLASLGLIAKGAFTGRPGSTAPFTQARPLPTLFIGIFGGIMVGLTSVGSGSLMMPLLLMIYPMLAARQLVGTDLVQAVPLVASAALGHILFGSVDFSLTLALVVGAIPAVWLGAHVSSRAPDYLIRPILAVVLVVSALKMLQVSNQVTGVIALFLCVGAGIVIFRGRKATLAAESTEPTTTLSPA
jgi:uncharacterized membrane protein YfcA